MNRRESMKLLGTGSVVVLMPASMVQCSTPQLEALRPWEGLADLPATADVRLKIVSYAILAPSAHNKQPWIVDLRGDGIDLYVDPLRLLPQTDPAGRQITISQGTFIEVLSVVASHFGLRADVKLFPTGIDPVSKIGNNPVAHVSLTKLEHTYDDPLFNFVLKRHTNRRVYGGPPLNDEEILALHQTTLDENYPCHIFSDSSMVLKIANLMTEAMRIETNNPLMHGETVSMLRFDDDEVEKYRDGIGFPNLGFSGMKLFLARLFSSRESAHEASFRERTIETMKDAAMSAQAIGMISSRGVSRVDEVEVGRCFARLHLIATKHELSLQPMSQVLEIESVKSQFIKEMKIQNQEPQMLFRLGRSEPTQHSPRRALKDFLRS